MKDLTIGANLRGRTVEIGEAWNLYRTERPADLMALLEIVDSEIEILGEELSDLARERKRRTEETGANGAFVSYKDIDDAVAAVFEASSDAHHRETALWKILRFRVRQPAMPPNEWGKLTDAEKHSIESDKRVVHKENRNWVVETYNALRSDHNSDNAAYKSVQEAYRGKFGREISISQIRTYLDHK